MGAEERSPPPPWGEVLAPQAPLVAPAFRPHALLAPGSRPALGRLWDSVLGPPGLLARTRDALLSLCSCRSFKRSEPVNPYHVGSGYVFAPATSANDSEISSDALTDDSMSMTDSSV